MYLLLKWYLDELSFVGDESNKGSDGSVEKRWWRWMGDVVDEGAMMVVDEGLLDDGVDVDTGVFSFCRFLYSSKLTYKVVCNIQISNIYYFFKFIST